jgi:aminopeptidase YwaD
MAGSIVPINHDSHMLIRNRPLLLLLALLLTHAAYGQSVEEEVRRDVVALTSRTMRGRGYNYDGHLRAALFISNRFRALGLESLSDDYLQPFPLLTNLFAPPQSLTLDGVRLRLGHDYVPSEMSGPGRVDGARVVDVGTGLFVPSAGIDNFSGRDVEGAVVVIDDHVPDELAKDTAIDRDLLSLFGRIEAASAFKARGAIVKVDRLTSGGHGIIAGIPVVEVRRDAFPGMPKSVSLAVENSMAEVMTQNVVAVLRGAEVPDSAIIICAHYDHLGSIDDSTWFPGANDNASGVAMMLSLARYFREHPPRYSVAFIAFSGEELGLLGSQHFVENPLMNLDRVRFLINLDMTASGRDGIMAVGGEEFPREFAMLRAVSDSAGLKEVRKRANAPNSDHFFFVRRGVPGFYIYPFTGLQPYHNVNDTPETLEWDVFLRLREIVRRFVEEF